MTAQHMELLVEEQSMEAFLRELLPRIMPADRTFDIHAFQGKPDLLGKLESRLRGYAHWLPDDWRLIVVVDRDGDDCRKLKRGLEAMAATARLRSRSQAQGNRWQIVNRIAVEELEAWYFGDWEAVRNAYPRVSPNVSGKQGFRDPDAVAGGTWEAFERILKQHGYFQTGLRKVEAARALGARIDPQRNRSRSFIMFHEAVLEAIA
ncbi:hypothetical protein B2A_07542 [mine drainage metagenome]|uniref:DUF4276 domain-containing protein n=1 Tax=mine drainage metagenome TaxID=410659 RepID=T0Y991_9ZZZZ